MKPFRFNLDALLRLRESEKERAQGLFVQAQQARRQARAVVDATLAAKAALGESMKQARGGAFSVAGQQQFLQAQAGVSDHLREARIQEQHRAKEAAAALQVYRAARLKVQMLEKLRERRRQSHEAAMERAEMLAIEDLVNARHGRGGLAAALGEGALTS
ncbi:MAG: hypothetical protein ACFB20_06865 [Opitutales bacterium]